MTSGDIELPQAVHLLTNPPWLLPIPGAWIHGAVLLLSHDLRHSTSLILDRLTVPNFQGTTIRTFVGLSHPAYGSHPAHGLSTSLTQYLPDLHEPQLTTAIANALHAHGSPYRRQDRLQAFLKALKAPEYLRKSLRHANPYNIGVYSEYRIDTGPIDLVIFWPRPKSRSPSTNAVVVEAKLGAPLQPNQLTRYREDADSMSHFENIYFVFLTMDGRYSRGSSSRWQSVSWLKMMITLENECWDKSGSFQLVKTLIWRKIRGDHDR